MVGGVFRGDLVFVVFFVVNVVLGNGLCCFGFCWLVI